MNDYQQDGFHYKDKIISSGPSEMDDYVRNCKGVGYELLQWMSTNSANVAQIVAETGEKDIYADLLRRSIRTAIEMQKIGIASDDVVSLCTDNHLNSPVPLIAAMFIGAKFSAFDYKASVVNLTHFAKTVKPKIIFVSTEALSNVEKSLENFETKPAIVVFGRTSSHLEFSTFISEKENENSFKPTEVENTKETAIIFFSSGTTGVPKGICLNHYALVRSITYFHTRQSVCFLTSTFYWISATLFLLSTAYYGSTRLVIQKFDPLEVWNYITKYKVTDFWLVPAFVIDLINSKPVVVYTRSVNKFMVAGAPISAAHILELKKLFPNTYVLLCYGQTECGVISIFDVTRESDSRMSHVKLQSLGRPINGFTCKVVNPDTEENLGLCEKGELRVKCDSIMNGYYKMDSSEVFDGDGWFKTGDIVYFDEDFCLYFVARRKELLKYRGSHIVPAVLENVLCSHPAVKEAAVLGFSQEDSGEDHAMALVILNKNIVPQVTPQDIVKYVNNRVDNVHQLRGGVQFVSRFLYNATGKLAKNSLRELVQNGNISEIQ